jgi:hypothetical protein
VPGFRKECLSAHVPLIPYEFLINSASLNWPLFLVGSLSTPYRFLVAKKLLPSFNPQGVSNLLWALAKLVDAGLGIALMDKGLVDQLQLRAMKLLPIQLQSSGSQQPAVGPGLPSWWMLGWTLLV